jgi:hypothetical protein
MHSVQGSWHSSPHRLPAMVSDQAFRIIKKKIRYREQYWAVLGVWVFGIFTSTQRTKCNIQSKFKKETTKEKWTKNDLQNIHSKRVTRTPITTGCELRCSGRVGSSCSSSFNRRVNLVKKPGDDSILFCLMDGVIGLIFWLVHINVV